MHAKITNNCGVAIPVVPWTYDKGVTYGIGTLEAGADLEINNPNIASVDLGEVPNFLSGLKAVLDGLSGLLRDVVNALIDKQGARVNADAEETMEVVITNHGAQAIRTIPGHTDDEFEIGPGETVAVIAPSGIVGAGKWIELRQLG